MREADCICTSNYYCCHDDDGCCSCCSDGCLYDDWDFMEPIDQKENND